ncbi:MAG: GatB/YqeY domain-containing protein [Thermoflexales bacterium]|nr:GatB/YqeY domain-containing protein [Thermoflexales bacterium]
MDNVKTRLQQDLKAAMRDKDELRKRVLRFTLAAIKNAEVDKIGELDEAEMDALLQAQVKRRRDTIDELEKAGRLEALATEKAELDGLLAYLPQQLSREEIEPVARAVIAELGASSPAQMGQVMKRLLAELKGRADGRLVSQLVKELLS